MSKQETYEEFLPELWGCCLFDSMRTKEGKVYGEGFLNKQLDYSKIWIRDIKKIPSRANCRLRNKNVCVYCKNVITEINGVGDHVVAEFIDRSIIWTVPCDRNCNSSKGKKDLIEWWCGDKGKNILELSRDVISIFVRAKFRHLQNENKLKEFVPEIYLTALQQVKDHWEKE